MAGQERGEKITKQQEYMNDFNKRKYVRKTIMLDKESDKDIIENLKTKKSMNEYIKNCIRKDMKGKIKT